MKTLLERIAADIEFDAIIRALDRDKPRSYDEYRLGDEIVRDRGYASQLRDLRDRLKRGDPVASDLDIEQFLAVDMLKQIRRMFQIPDEQAIIPFLNEMLNQWSREPDGIQSLDI